MQFDSAVNRWNPCKHTGRINASNPCSEYMFLDDSACNLASLNLMKFVGPDGQFDVEAFRHAVDTVILAQEIFVDTASYPTEKIAENSHDFRPLGLGFANLGALLMSLGLPYDSEPGPRLRRRRHRDHVRPGLPHQRAHRRGGGTVRRATQKNEEPFLEVIRMHRDSVSRIDRAPCAGRWPRRRSGSGTTPTNRAGATATATRRSP